ncbi:MAG: sn-glycerol-3-phosphate ABC transporter ATP-binding protein UgpC [Veillonellaceae bacterium]|jgi:multiple sugar transport system ATP-binding protein|nr:sn-glycerol-3-phosphate ABC transporter ATP-binding protein UgpC [Veillonellaceae bacterium]
MAGVSLRKISKLFGAQTAVAPMDLEIADGEFLVLVGPSGCGKTTTLRMIAGLETPTAGEIRIGDRDVTHLEPKHRDIAMVFQNYALYPHMTVYANMAYSLRLRGMDKAEMEQRIRKAAAILGIEALLDRLPRQLSGGQQQRVALGRAIVRDPQVFLMDEPLSNLDAKLRVQTRAELIKLHKRLNTTVVYVTHDQVEAMTMGTRIVVMKDGYVQQVGEPGIIYREPANMFVAAFIGSPPMQFLRGRTIRGNADVIFQGIGFELPLPDFGEHTPIRDGIVLGVRPENLELTDEAAAIPAIVDVVENIGSEALIHGKTPDGELIVVRMVTPETVPAAGERIQVKPARGNLHLFDATSGAALALAKIKTNG